MVKFCSIEASRVAYSLAVENVFTTHDRVHGRRVFECQEGKPARPAVLVPQDSAILDLTKLREVFPQSFVGRVPTETSDEHFAVICCIPVP